MPVNTVPYKDHHRVNKPQRRAWRIRAKQREPTLTTLKPGKAVAIDCEGIELLKEDGDDLSGKRKKGLGQVSVVDEDGNLLYDTFAYHPENVKWKLHPKQLNLGVKMGDVQPEVGAQPLEKVFSDLKSIFDASGLIIGHGLDNEFSYLRGIDFTVYELRDTQRAGVYQQYAKSTVTGPSLKSLSVAVLNRTIQEKSHSAAEDAKATMELYLHERESMDHEQAGVKFGADRVDQSDPDPDQLDLYNELMGFGPDTTYSAFMTTGTFISSTVASSSAVPDGDNGEESAQTSAPTAPTTDAASTAATTSTVTTRSMTSTSAPVQYQPALPDLPRLRNGKTFDKNTSRYN